jgi:hypothetical protein
LATCFTTKTTKEFHKDHEEFFVSFVKAFVPFVVNSLKRLMSVENNEFASGSEFVPFPIRCSVGGG